MKRKIKGSWLFLGLLLTCSLAMAGDNEFDTVWTDVPWGEGGLTPQGSVWSMDGPFDIDQDGNADFVASSSWTGTFKNEIMVYEVAGDDDYQLVFWYLFSDLDSTAGNFSSVTVGDIDNDGNDEIIALADCYAGQDGFYVFEWDGTDWNGTDNFINQPTPTATWDLDLPQGVFETGDVLVTNLDSDDNDEVVVSVMHTWAIPGSSRVMIFELDQTTSFDFPVWNVEMQDDTTFQYSGYMAQDTDMDQDGNKEVVIVGWNNFNFVMFENTAEDIYEKAVSLPGVTYPDYDWFCNEGVAEADLDGDGLNELYIAASGSGGGGGAFWVLTLDQADISTLEYGDFHLLKLYDTSLGLRQVLIGNQDSPVGEAEDGVDIYIAGNWHEAVFDWEYNGGDVTDPTSYTEYTIFQDDTTIADLRIAKMILGDDMDGDGSKEVAFCSADLSSLTQPHFLMLEHQGEAGVNGSFVPITFAIHQNYPNPFNPSTQFAFDLPEASYVEVTISNLLGAQVRTLHEGNLERGNYSFQFDGMDDVGNILPTGTYIYTIESGGQISSRKMVLLK